MHGMSRPYHELTVRGQVSCLRPFAREACRLFGLDDPKVKLLHHAFNTTFAISSGGTKYALRLNTNSNRTRDELNAEVAWTSVLSQRDDISVPRPYETTDGAPFAELDWPELDRPLCAALYSWLPGKVAYDAPTLFAAQELGRATRTLHHQASDWKLPQGFGLKPFDSILFHKPLCLADRGFKGDLGVFTEVEQRANDVLTRLGAEARIPIHSDLHLGNVMVCRNRVSVFDFDDSFMGHPLIDVAVSLFYLRRNEGCEGMDEAYWRGFGLPPAELSSEEDLEALIAGRGLMMCNEIFDMKTADIIAIAHPYAEVTETRLRHYLNTGRFDPNIASLPR